MDIDMRLAEQRLEEAASVMLKIQEACIKNATGKEVRDEAQVSFTLEEFEFLIASVMMTEAALRKGIEKHRGMN